MKWYARLGAATAALTAIACGEQSRAPTAVVTPTPPPSATPDVTISASTGVNLDQWANGDPAPTGESWQNGNLNGNNSDYAERKAVPFRLAMEGLSAGNHSIIIQYDFTAGGHKAYDFLASIDATEPNALAQICATGGGGRSSLCGVSNTTMPGTVSYDDEPFPGDAFEDPQSSKTVDQAIAFEALSRNLRIYGGTIVSIGVVTHVGDTNGNSTGQMAVVFNVPAGTGAAQLVWSGHLAYSVFWNDPTDPDGAGQVSGAPWHMRTLNLDGGGAANQDRSIQPSALADVPVLSIVKSTSTGTVSAGSSIAYTVVVTNEGPGTANNVTISDDLPGGTGIDWSIQTNPDNACSITGSPPSETLSCTFTSLAAGASKSVTVTSATTAASCATYQNSASTSSTNGDGATSDIISIVVQCPNLDVQKTPDAQTVSAGSAITFSIVVSNGGPGTATGVQLSDNLPGGNAGNYVDWSIVVGSPTSTGSPSISTLPTCQITGALGSEVLTCSSINLTSGQAYTIQVTASTSAASCAEYNNTATATATNDAQETDAGKITVDCPDLDVQKTPNTQNVSAGDAITFSIVVSNGGPGTATGVQLSDNLPGGNAGNYVDWSIVVGSPTSTGSPSISTLPTCQITGALGSEVLTCSSINLTSGQAYTIQVTASTSAASCAEYNNTATATATNDAQETDGGQITVQCPDLDVQKTPDQQVVNAGTPISFSIVVSNGGPGTAKGVALTDNLPGGNVGTPVTWAIAAGSPTSTGNPTIGSLPTCSITGSPGSQVLTCGSIDLTAGQAYTVTVNATTAATSCMIYENTATATATNDAQETDQGTIEVRCPSACTLTIGFWKTHAGQYKWGQGNQGDAITALLPQYLGTQGGAKTVTVSTAQQAVSILSFNNTSNSTASNGITKLYAQLLAAKLNVANGADGSTISAAILAADTFLATHNEADWNGLTKPQKNQVLSWMSTFDTFNNSGHCP